MFLNCLGFCSSKDTSSSQRQYPTVIEELCRQFSLADLWKATNNFDQDKVIRHGRFGKVYKGCLQHNDASDYTVALKRFNAEDIEGCEQFKKEIELLCQLRHPNCVSLIGFCNHKNEKILVLEYMSNGSLEQHLRREGREALSWKKRLEICIGAARGLHYLHTGAKRSIFHCNLTASKILLDDHMKPKLSSFGFSLQRSQFMPKPKPIDVDRILGNNTLSFEIRNSSFHMAKECFTVGAITDKSDVYSFGVVLLEVVCGLDFYIMVSRSETIRRESLEKRVVENIDPNIKGNIAPECWEVFIDIIIRCLKHEPAERPTMGELEVELEHALSLQEEADITNTNGGYTLLSKTIINFEPKWEFEHALSVHQEANIKETNCYYSISDFEDSDIEDMFPSINLKGMKEFLLDIQ